MNHLSWLTRSQLKILVCIFIIPLVNVTTGSEDGLDFSFKTNDLSLTHTNTPGIQLCSSKYLVGNCIRIVDLLNESCIDLSMSKNKIDENSVQSLGLNGHCVYVYDNFGCEGKIMMLSPAAKVQCQVALPTCRHQNRIRSLRICGARLAHKYLRANGTSGKPCKSDCATRNSSFFWCYLYDDSRDYCFPGPGQHFLIGVDCNETNCTNPEHWESDHVVLYSESSFQGKAVELITNLDNKHCVTNLRNAIKIRSISTKEKCIKLYNEIGCNGGAIRLDKWSTNWETFRDLAISYNGAVASISHCNFSLSPPHLKPKGYQGQQCLSSCQTYGKPFFWCIVGRRKWDYCSPRPGQDYLGNFCNTSCLKPDYNNQTWLPVLYEFPNFRGRNFTLENEGRSKHCYNFSEWNLTFNSPDDLVTSIDVKGKCVALYDEIGCTGNVVWIYDAITVLQDILPQQNPYIEDPLDFDYGYGIRFIGPKYGLKAFKKTLKHDLWNTIVRQIVDNTFSGSAATIVESVFYGTRATSGMTKSLGICEDIPNFRISSPVGSRGEICASKCTTQGKPFFWCHLSQPNTWDFCVPARGMDYLGKPCTVNCSHEERPHQITLFESASYHGDQHDVEYQNDRMCYNLQTTTSSSTFIPMFKYGVGSLNLFGNCVQLYTGIGCTGKFVEVIPGVHDHCQDDTKACFSSSNWLSFRFCTMKFPPLCKVSVTSSGHICIDSCKPRDNGNFSCATENGTVEDCYPRDTVDSTGQYFCSTCKCAGKKIRFFTRSDFKGIESFTYVRSANQCYSVASPQSVDLGDTNCIHLFHSEGCNNNASMYIYENDTTCKTSLHNCFSISLNSFKLCDNFRSKGIGQRSCRTKCHTTEKHPYYFNCNVTDDIVAFCSLNSKQNHLGEACNNDTCNFSKLYPSVVLPFSHSQLPKLYHLPVALSGSLCQDGCETRGKHYFWCHLNKRLLERCAPRPGTNSYGQNTPNKLKRNIELPVGSIVHSDVVVLYSGNYFTGNNLTVYNVTEQMCISFNPLALNQDVHVNATSVALNGNCIYIYDDFGCDGKFEILSPYLNEQCQLSLSLCNWSKKISSIRHCNVTLPEKFTTANGSLGLPCSNECKIRQDPNYFSCNLNNGTQDYCNPRPMQNFLLTNCSQNCTSPEFWDSNNAVVYKNSYFRGAALEIILEDANDCINLVRTDFYESIGSINLKNQCINIYEQIGCSGQGVDARAKLTDKCLRDLKQCYMNNNIASFSFCKAPFSKFYEYAVSLQGEPCSVSCEPRRQPYFWCFLKKGSWDFCSPGQGRDYLGNNCNGTCSLPDFGNHFKLPVLYEHRNYQGRKFVLEGLSSTRCFNLRFWNNTAKNFDKLTSSVFTNGYCLDIYTDIGCTGRFGYWSHFRGSTHSKLKGYYLSSLSKLNDKIVSVKICEKRIPGLREVSHGSRGDECSTKCATLGKNFFWCQLNLHNAWDFCSPRNGTDFFGDDCTNDCNHIYRPYKVTLFGQPHFQGYRYDVEYNQSRICYNLGQLQSQHEFQNGIASIELNGNCVFLYSDIGCTGNPTEFIPTVNDECQKDIKHCMPDKSWSSIRFCTTELPELCPTTFGTRGLRCTSACQPRQNDFTCKVNNLDEEDLCVPRDGINSSGEFKCTKCKCYHDGVIILHSEVDFSGNIQILHPKSGTDKCFTLDSEPFHDFNFHHKIGSVTLNATDCIHLYAGIGCTGSFITLNTTTSCLKNIEDCPDWNLCTCKHWTKRECSCREPHFSLRICNAKRNLDNAKHFVSKDTAVFSQTVSGIPCLSACTAPGYYFTCNISGGMQDFCRHTTEQNHIGQTCLYDNCVHKQPHGIVALHTARKGEYNQISFKEINVYCYNIRNFSRSQQNSFTIDDISTENNSTCLILYNDIGCTGDNVKFSNIIENPCLNNSKRFCNRTFQSLRFCDTDLPSLYPISIGSAGKLCQSKCETMGKPFFWCFLDDGFYDLCSPRPGLNFFGGNCENCTLAPTTIKEICSSGESQKTMAFCNSGDRLANVGFKFIILIFIIVLGTIVIN